MAEHGDHLTCGPRVLAVTAQAPPLELTGVAYNLTRLFSFINSSSEFLCPLCIAFLLNTVFVPFPGALS